MNVMISNNIDNSLQSKRDLSIKSNNMGEEKKFVIKLRTSVSEGEMEPAKAIELTKAVSTSALNGKKTKRKRKSPLIPWKKPVGMPKRPLSAYNLFFQDRRKSIMLAASESSENIQDESKKSLRKSSKKRSGVGFANLARTIGTEWRALEPEKKAPYNGLAGNDKNRYNREMKVWRVKEKEEKLLRESNANRKNQLFDCVAVLPAFAKGLCEGNKGTDASLPVTDLIEGLGAGDILHPLQDHESRGVFNSSINNNFNNNSYSLETSSNQPSTVSLQQQQQDANSFSSRQLAQFNNSDPYNLGVTNAAGYQNQLFNTSGSFNNNSQKMMSWNNPRNAVIMENMLGSSIDLEPLPLPDNYQQDPQKLFEMMIRDNQMNWSNQHHTGLQQMHAHDQQQQQRISSASNNQYLRRVSTGGEASSLYSSVWGQQNANEPILVPLGDRIMNQTSEKNMVSQDMASTDNSKNRNASNQDPWKPIGFFNEAPN